MKKFFGKALLVLLVCLSLSTAAFASEYGSIDAMDEIVTPEAEGAIVVTAIEATTDAEGKLAYPKNGEIISTEVTAGTMVGDWTEETKGALSYYVIQFAEKESPVAMTVTSKVTDAYALKAAKAASTSIKGVNTLTYKMSNTSPIKISGYVVAVAVPSDQELIEISGYSAKSGYAIYDMDGYTYGEKEVGSVAAGGSHTLTISTRAPMGMVFRIGLVVIAVAVSVLYLYKEKHLLAIAAEKKVEEKQRKAAERAKNAAEREAAKAAKLKK